MRPPGELLDRLGGLRLLGNSPGRSLRQGERRSRAKGAGLEFAGHRPYREGDDLRHLDTRLYARLRQPFMREYLADRQLRVAILIDASASMDFGSPSKSEVAGMLAGLLGYAGLSSGDLVEVGIAQAGRVNWSDAMQGASRSDHMFRWIDAGRGGSTDSFPAQLEAALPRLRMANVTILIGDWWIDDMEREMQILGRLPGHICAVQMTSPEEESPLLSGSGLFRLSDSETSDILDLFVNASGTREYVDLLARHRQALRAQMERINGRFVSVHTDMGSDELVRTLVSSGLLA